MLRKERGASNFPAFDRLFGVLTVHSIQQRPERPHRQKCEKTTDNIFRSNEALRSRSSGVILLWCVVTVYIQVRTNENVVSNRPNQWRPGRASAQPPRCFSTPKSSVHTKSSARIWCFNPRRGEAGAVELMDSGSRGWGFGSRFGHQLNGVG